MEIILTRIAKRQQYTIGRLAIVERTDDEYLAGEREVYFCDTLEPPVIETKTTVSLASVLRSPVKLKSIKPVAIPEGRYAVVITYSPKFNKWLPLLLGGQDFNRLWQGIRIHFGNTVADTQGCILLGRNQRVGSIEAKARKEAVWITIR